MAKKQPDKQAKNRTPNGRFKPGVSGNPAGRPKSRTLSEAYREMLKQPLPGDPTRTYADVVAAALCKKAVEGDVNAARELADRTEGKPRQALDVDLNSFDWMELAQANGLNIHDVIAEAKLIIAESVADGSGESSDQTPA